MPPPRGEIKLKEEIKWIFCEVILPRRTVPETARKMGIEADDKILLKALEQARKRIGAIIDQMQVVNSKTLDLRIPGPEFLEVLLQMEYLYHISLFGEKGTLKYLKRIKESDNRILVRMLNSYGYYRPEDLQAEEKAISSGSGDKMGARALNLMKSLLENNPGGIR